MHRNIIPLLLAVSSLSSCRSAPPPWLTDPRIAVAVTHHAGDALAANFESPASLTPETVWAVSARAFVFAPATLAAMPPSAVPQASLLLEPKTDDPIRGTSPMLHELRLATDDAARALVEVADHETDDATRAMEYAELRGALPDQGTCELTIRRSATDSILVAIARRGAVAQVALRRDVDGRAVELAVLETSLRAAGAPLWLQFPGAAGQVLAFVIELRNGDPADPQHVAAVAAFVADSARAAMRLTARVAKWSAADAEGRISDTAWGALGVPDQRRNALLVLAGATARLAADLAVVATPAMLEAWAEQLRTTIGADLPPGAAIAWEVERTAIELLAGRVDRAAATPSEVGLLLRHFGEAGRFPVDLVRFVRGAADRDVLDRWLIAENRRLLESSDPASRIRALDWLAARGESPAEFDPFAGRDARRRALRAAEAAREAAAQEGGR